MIRTAKHSDSHAKVGDKLAPWETASEQHWKRAIKIDQQRERTNEQDNEQRIVKFRKKFKQA